MAAGGRGKDRFTPRELPAGGKEKILIQGMALRGKSHQARMRKPLNLARITQK